MPHWSTGGYLQKTHHKGLFQWEGKPFGKDQATWDCRNSTAAEGPGDSPSHPQTRPVELSASRNALQQRHRLLTLGQKICWDMHPGKWTKYCWDMTHFDLDTTGIYLGHNPYSWDIYIYVYTLHTHIYTHICVFIYIYIAGIQTLFIPGSKHSSESPGIVSSCQASPPGEGLHRCTSGSLLARGTSCGPWPGTTSQRRCDDPQRPKGIQQAEVTQVESSSDLLVFHVELCRYTYCIYIYQRQGGCCRLSRG